MVAGQAGLQVPRRAWSVGRVEDASVAVFSPNGKVVRVAVPPYEVRDCGKQAQLILYSSAVINAPDSLRLDAKLFGSEGLTIRSVRWRFGDGVTAVGGATIEHSFAQRDQDDEYSYFLVEAEATLDDGRRLLGRLSVELVNDAALARRAGVALLMTSLEPRFPEVSPDGSVEQTVELWHTESEPVRLTKVQIVERGPSAPRGAKLLDASAVVDAEEVESGEQVSFRARLDPDQDTTEVTYTIYGELPDGTPAQGTFSVLRPVGLPTAKSSVPVSDEALTRRILLARRLLRKAYVTQGDLEKLQSEGAFEGLEEPVQEL